MTHYLIELAVWMLAFFFAGCLLGVLLKKLFAPDVSVAADSVPAAAASVTYAPVETAPVPPAVEPVRAVSQTKKVAPEVKVSAPSKPGKMERPKGIAAARSGKPDKLQRLSGVGPKNEKVLHSLGFFHFDQIAAWTSEQIEWVDNHLKFNGRIRREEWTKQARLLAEGKEQEFARLYGTGGMKNRQGEKLSGSRTRRN